MQTCRPPASPRGSIAVRPTFYCRTAPQADISGDTSNGTFSPHRCDAGISVLGSVSVATVCLLPDGPAARLAVVPEGARKTLSFEHLAL